MVKKRKNFKETFDITVEMTAGDLVGFPDVDVDDRLSFDILIKGKHLSISLRLSYYRDSQFVGDRLAMQYENLVRQEFADEIAAFACVTA